MSWREHFNNLKGLEKKRADEYRHEMERKTAEMQRIHKIYSSKIEEVCKEFAKAVHWKYRGIEKESFEIKRTTEFYCVRFRISSGNEHNPAAFEVTLDCNGVHVKGDYSSLVSPEYSFHRNETISLADFTQEKLADIFAKWYEKLLSL
jgi:hypothetical protein